MSMQVEPGQTVAVVIPVYNATYLDEALESVFQQTRPADEVIVVDDGTPDRGRVHAAVDPWQSRIVLRHQSNSGAAAARNAGVAVARSEFVAFLDADDRWAPTFLHEQLTFLQTHPHVDLVYSDAVVIGDTAATGRSFMSMCPSEGDVTLGRLLAQSCTVITSTVVVRRRVVTGVGGFDVALRRGQDFDLWLRLASSGATLAYQRRALGYRRVHAENLSGTRIDELERAQNIFHKAVETLPLTEPERRAAEGRVQVLGAELAREYGKRSLAEGDFGSACRLFERAARTLPGWKLPAVVLAIRLMPRVVRSLYLARTARSRSRSAPTTAQAT